MTGAGLPSASSIETLRGRLDSEAESAGYHLNPDLETTRGLVAGLLLNESRYGYRACPCRLARGQADADRDIVCPCDYRDADILDWGSCYCGLYVSDEVRQATKALSPVPERRPGAERRQALRSDSGTPERGEGLRVWRCRVCGYLCARGRPPAVCPICKATFDRFEVFG